MNEHAETEHIVEVTCLNDIINWLAYEGVYRDDTSGKCSKLLKKEGYYLAKKSDCRRLFQDMLNLNIQAVEIRYPDYEIYSEHIYWTHSRNAKPSLYQVLKSIQNWLYECTEGEPMESNMLYVTFHKIMNIINASITASLVERMPQYKKAGGKYGYNHYWN